MALEAGFRPGVDVGGFTGTVWSRAETGAGGFSTIDGTVQFFSRVQSVLPPEGIVVDFGAGRGKWTEDSCTWRRRLCDLRGAGRVVVGLDIDWAVAENRGLDAAVMIDSGASLPFADRSVRLVVADWVFEHLDNPRGVASELARVVAPGGWVCARTPNKWGYIALGSRLVPQRHHVRALRTLQPGRAERDVFPTRYRLNTLVEVARAFPPPAWRDCSHPYNPDPGYVGHSKVATGLVAAWQRLAPPPLSATLHVFVQRRAG